jgi:hypothetical protein
MEQVTEALQEKEELALQLRSLEQVSTSLSSLAHSASRAREALWIAKKISPPHLLAQAHGFHRVKQSGRRPSRLSLNERSSAPRIKAGVVSIRLYSTSKRQGHIDTSYVNDFSSPPASALFTIYTVGPQWAQDTTVGSFW